jgi:hypothetical protein
VHALHVIPDERSAIWRVFQEDVSGALSEHTNATDAEIAAQALAARLGAERIVVRDRYHRTREPSLAAVRTGARAARARQIVAIRERLHQTHRSGPRATS